MRAQKLRQQPCCEWCGAKGPGLHVDHIKSVRQRPDLWDDLSNLRVLCASCHEKRSNRDGHRGKAPQQVFECDESGFPIGADHPWNRPRGS